MIILKMFSRILISILIVISIQLIICTKSEVKTSIKLKNGLIDGKRETFDGREYDVFLGIPYALSPVGQLRFRKPLPVQPWDQSIDATQWPKACIHKKMHENYFNGDMSEDCLHLNIWSPVWDQSSGALKPVMFFIHGGGLLFGSSVEDFYSGHVLAVKGEVVVVTFNYRLGIFGLLYTGSDEAPGNIALWDQALALEWVNENIRYFGGDPNRITVFGESAGGIATSLHVLSPVSRHMFQNAIVMSGAAIDNQSLCAPDVLLKYFVDISISMGCISDENTDELSPKFSPKMIECLRSLTPEKLSEERLEAIPGCLSYLALDGHFMPDLPLNMLKNGDHKKNINLLIGTVEDEGSIWLSMIINPVKYDRYTPKDIGYDEAYNDLKQIISILNPDLGPISESVAKLYFKGLSDNNSSDVLRRTIGIAIGDYILSCPTIQYANNIFKNIQNSNVYQYYYNFKAETYSYLCSQWMGSCHMDDIFPVFGQSFTDWDRHEDREREISQEMIEIFSSFAKTGKPSLIDKSIDWQKYYRIDDKIISPFYEITSHSKNGNNFGNNLKQNQCQYLFNKY